MGHIYEVKGFVVPPVSPYHYQLYLPAISLGQNGFAMRHIYEVYGYNLKVSASYLITLQQLC